MYLLMRRLKAAKLVQAQNRLKELTRDLTFYDVALQHRGIDVVMCNVCVQLNWICVECNALTCRTECPRCQLDTERITRNALSH